MKKIKLNEIGLIIGIFLVLGCAIATQNRFWAMGWGDLSVKGAAAVRAANTDPAAAMEYIKECNSLHPGAISAEELEFILDQGYLTGYVDELKSLGYISAGYAGGGSSVPAQTETTDPEPAPEPAAFTVEDMEDTPMWATQVVNYRDGASTDYNKLGSLEQYEQVTVNGVASTGWYRFNTPDGTAVYVSDKYLTKEDPSNRELNIYNQETGQVDTYIFEDGDPEAIDEAVDDIKEDYADKEPAVEEPEPVTAEPVPEETVKPEPVVEPVTEPVVEEPARPWQFYASVVCAVLCVMIISISVYYLVRNKKRGRVD